MITGFNPADMYAADHIRRVLKTFPGGIQRDWRIFNSQGICVRKNCRYRLLPLPIRPSTGSLIFAQRSAYR